MSDKELLVQVLNREIGNILGNINPILRNFSGTLTNYIVEVAEPYLAAFTSKETNQLNTKMAGAYLKEETDKKIEEFIKRFEKEQQNGEL